MRLLIEREKVMRKQEKLANWLKGVAIYWPTYGGKWVCINPLIHDLQLASLWGCTPWQLSGRDVNIYRPIYITLQSLLTRAERDVDFEEERARRRKSKEKDGE